MKQMREETHIDVGIECLEKQLEVFAILNITGEEEEALLLLILWMMLML